MQSNSVLSYWIQIGQDNPHAKSKMMGNEMKISRILYSYFDKILFLKEKNTIFSKITL